jgi:squalene-hopene/tetraprenyl-beta-curcumene cyclase
MTQERATGTNQVDPSANGQRSGTARVAEADGTHAQDGDPTGLDQGIESSKSYLLGQQYEKGYWWAELEANCAIHAEYLLLTHFLGVPNKEHWRKLVNYLKAKQIEDGGWPIWYGGPGDLSIAVECYFAMKLAGVDVDDPVMVKARKFILSKGGVPETRIFTKMWLALFGQWDWRGTPVLPAEMILAPNWFPFNIYEFASWARGTIVACTVLLSERPVCPVPDSAHVDELYPAGREGTKYRFGKERGLFSWHTAFRAIDAALRGFERFPIKPLRRLALKKAEQWIVERQEADGSWAGIQPPWVYSLMALKTLGYPSDHPVIQKGLSGFFGPEGFAHETDEYFWTEPCLSPGWDTCLVMMALQDAELPTDHPALVQGTEWLLAQQTLDHWGDFQIKRPRLRPGGWAFEFANQVYPDTDDAAMVMIALNDMGWRDEPRMQRSLDAGCEWIEGMQSKNGGWGSFDVDNTKFFAGEIPFCDFGEVLDWPTEDVTAHILEAFGRMGYDTSRPSVARGLAYLKETQDEDGSWWGRWGVNYVYGIGAVLPALQAIGEDMSQAYVGRAVTWLELHQNEDGGWGECVESYCDPALKGQGPSTASQTGWALLGMVAVGQAHGESAKRGVEYLLSTQQSDGSWDEPYFTATGFPMDFMINYHMYRNCWPLMSLGRYRKALRQGG